MGVEKSGITGDDDCDFLVGDGGTTGIKGPRKPLDPAY